jgi:lipopolysaccharide export LptBFGC system permease protein LptF
VAAEEEKGIDPVEETEKTMQDVQEELELETEAEREAREKKEEEKRKISARRRRLIPPFVMLLAGAVVSIAMRLFRYETRTMLIVLLIVLVVFYLVGEVIKYMLDQFEKQIEENKAKEGEVIEKELSGEATSAPEKKGE